MCAAAVSRTRASRPIADSTPSARCIPTGAAGYAATQDEDEDDSTVEVTPPPKVLGKRATRDHVHEPRLIAAPQCTSEA